MIIRDDEFRTAFRHIGEIRSILPSGVKVMALTATATMQLRGQVMKSLSMTPRATVTISESPHRPNILYSASKFR